MVLQESFTGTKIVKAFGREALEQERFDEVNDRLMRLALKDHRTDQLAEPLMEVMGALGLMGALWYGGFQVISGALTPGEFFSFTAAVLLLYGPVRQLSRMVNTVQQSLGSVERVFQILDTPQAIVDAPARRHAAGLSRPARLRGRVVLLSGDDGAGAARHLARDARRASSWPSWACRARARPR